MRGIVDALILLSLLVPLATQAQEVPQVRPGDRVRVTAPECELHKQKAILVSVENEVLTAISDDQAFECPVEAFTRLEVSVGERKWWKASLVGMGVGVGMMFVVAVPLESDEFGDKNSLIAASLAPIGLVTGTVVGLIRGKDSWEEVSLPPMRPSFHLSAKGQLAIGFSVPLRR